MQIENFKDHHLRERDNAPMVWCHKCRCKGIAIKNTSADAALLCNIQYNKGSKCHGPFTELFSLDTDSHEVSPENFLPYQAVLTKA